MNIEIRVNILPWNEFRAEFSIPAIEEKEEIAGAIVIEDVSIEKPIIPSSEPHVPPSSLTVVLDT
ncbi:hypothetical protein DRP04_14110 [Archaeoglobales archaeon]|nr:MAG: hypothetical protein DRP04_14110 [Archaeoglobales archaeon]